MKDNVLYRNIGTVELRSEEPYSVTRTITGYAVVFESESNDLGFIEVIKRGAITQELVDNCDIFCKFNHDDNKVLARSNKGKGSLKLTVDDKGLRYEFEAPNTDLGNELLEYIKRGDLYQSSFAFALAPDDTTAQKWEKRNGTYYRTIYKIAALYDVSPVWQPAYSETSVDKRSLDEYNKIVERDNKYDEMLKELENYYIN